MALEGLLGVYSRDWWVFVLRGGLAVLFGVLAFAWPGIALLALVTLWGAFALADGVLSLIAAFRIRRQGRPSWPLILIGFLGIAVGVATFIWPGITAIALLVFIAFWALVTGILQIVMAIRLRKEIENEWFLGLAGALSVVFGILMIARPGAGALAVAWIIGAYAVFFGVLLIALGFRLRRLSGAPALESSVRRRTTPA
jgi:uncharacterized membrane protein HdeD (DUF308 family)